MILAIATSYALTGLLTWWWLIWESKELRVGDLLMILPIGVCWPIVIFMRVVIFNSDKIIWRRE